MKPRISDARRIVFIILLAVFPVLPLVTTLLWTSTLIAQESQAFQELIGEIDEWRADVMRNGLLSARTPEARDNLYRIRRHAEEQYWRGNISETERNTVKEQIDRIAAEIDNPDTYRFLILPPPPPQSTGLDIDITDIPELPQEGQPQTSPAPGESGDVSQHTRIYSLPPRPLTEAEELFDRLREIERMANKHLNNCRCGDIRALLDEVIMLGMWFPEGMSETQANNALNLINRMMPELYTLYYTCVERCGEKGVHTTGRKTAVTATVTVQEEEKVQVARQVGGQVVATVVVNDKPQKPPATNEDIAVKSGDVVQLISTAGDVLASFDFVPKKKKDTVKGRQHPDFMWLPKLTDKPTEGGVVECPLGETTVVTVPGNYSNTPIDDLVVNTELVAMALTTSPDTATPPAIVPEKTAAATTTKELTPTVTATAPTGTPSTTSPPPKLMPILKTVDTVVAAGTLDDADIGSSEVTVTNKNTGEVLGETEFNTWRLAGASLNPPVVDKGGQTSLKLNIYGPPDLPVVITATAGEGLTPRTVKATAPIGVLQSYGAGAFTATQPGQHSVTVTAAVASGAFRCNCGCGGTPQPSCAHKGCVCAQASQTMPALR